MFFTRGNAAGTMLTTQYYPIAKDKSQWNFTSHSLYAFIASTGKTLLLSRIN